MLYVEPLGNAAVNRRRVSAGYELMSFLLTDARSRRRGGSSGDPIGATSAAALIGGLSEIVTAWIDGHIAADRETLVADVTALFVALLGAAADIATAARRRPDRPPHGDTARGAAVRSAGGASTSAAGRARRRTAGRSASAS